MDRLERVRTIRASLRSGTSVVGSWMQLTDSNVAEIMGRSGYQWVAIDMEHGPVSLSQLPDLFVRSNLEARCHWRESQVPCRLTVAKRLIKVPLVL